jgi:hypothetical protein
VRHAERSSEVSKHNELWVPFPLLPEGVEHVYVLLLPFLQGVLSMAREADPKGLRTLGVLTKPDQVEQGCHGQWMQVLQGKR